MSTPIIAWDSLIVHQLLTPPLAVSANEVTVLRKKLRSTENKETMESSFEGELSFARYA